MIKQTYKQRQKYTAEVFTPPKLVNEILDKLPKEVWESNKTFCDPACGNGNIVIEIYKRKILNSYNELESLKTIYGVDLMEDNIDELKKRLLSLIPEELHKKAKKILNKNFICHDALKWDFINWESKNKVIESYSLF